MMELDNMIAMLERELDDMRIGKFEGLGDHKYHRMFLTVSKAIQELRDGDAPGDAQEGTQ